MALSMPRPYKHPNTGIYWLRKRMPDAVQPLIGKREIRRSLKTTDPTEGKRRHREAPAGLETKWANLKAGQRTLAEREAPELAVYVKDRWLEIYKDNLASSTVR